VCGPGPSSKVIATAPCSLGVVLGGLVYGFVVVLGFATVVSLDKGVVSVVVGAVEGEVSWLSFVVVCVSVVVVKVVKLVVALDVSCDGIVVNVGMLLIVSCGY